MKILHCADLHMDSPMETHMTSEQARIRNAEILKSFRRMTEYAEQQKIRLVLIAGDLFDRERITKRTVEAFWMLFAVRRRSIIFMSAETMMIRPMPLWIRTFRRISSPLRINGRHLFMVM